MNEPLSNNWNLKSSHIYIYILFPSPEIKFVTHSGKMSLKSHDAIIQ